MIRGEVFHHLSLHKKCSGKQYVNGTLSTLIKKKIFVISKMRPNAYHEHCNTFLLPQLIKIIVLRKLQDILLQFKLL